MGMRGGRDLRSRRSKWNVDVGSCPTADVGKGSQPSYGDRLVLGAVCPSVKRAQLRGLLV